MKRAVTWLVVGFVVAMLFVWVALVLAACQDVGDGSKRLSLALIAFSVAVAFALLGAGTGKSP